MLKDLFGFHKGKFTKTDHKISKWVLKNKLKLSNNIAQTSKDINVSPSAITRFCQKINLSGWGGLLFLIKKNWKKPKKSTDSNELNDIIFSLSRTEKLITPEVVELLVKMIEKSEHVYLYGESFTYLAATQFSRKLNKIGIVSRVFNVASDLAIIMPKNNGVHIMISMSGMNPNIKSAAKKLIIAAKKGKIFFQLVQVITLIFWIFERGFKWSILPNKLYQSIRTSINCFFCN